MHNNNPIFKEIILKKLISDFNFKTNGNYLQKGTCPNCNKKELYSNAEKPFWVKCNRENKCNYYATTKELYPELYSNFYNQFKPTETNPNKTADAYMHYSRGLDVSKIKGWYRQGNYKNHPTILFDIDKKNNISMERFLKTETFKNGDRKAHFNGSYKGLCWHCPTNDFNHDNSVFIVEGCIDAISLKLSGYNAIANLSCGNFPFKYLETLSKNIKLIWALDNDNAGRKYTKKHISMAKNLGFINQQVAFLKSNDFKKSDWNDIYLKDSIISKNVIEDAIYYGKLFLSKTPLEKGKLIAKKTNKLAFIFSFLNSTYCYSMIKSEDNESNNNASIKKIASCKIEFLYYYIDEMERNIKRVARITSERNNQSIIDFTPRQISDRKEFNLKILGSIIDGDFTGTNKHLKEIKDINNNLPEVRMLPYTGYDEKSRAYIFNNIAIKGNTIFYKNNYGFFEIDQHKVKSMYDYINLEIGKKEDYNENWFNHFYEAYGTNGIISLAFWVGSLFVTQIREKYQSYPFLEISGEPNSGKSSLIYFIWKLIGRKGYEGFDPSKSTISGLFRTFNQISNLPYVLLEADRTAESSKYKRFDWDNLKSAYNGGGTITRGKKTQDNSTYSPDFKGSIVIAQNEEVKGSDAINSRIVRLNVSTKNHTIKGEKSSKFLMDLKIENLSYFLMKVLTKEKKILGFLNENINKIYDEISALDIKNSRIKDNYSQIICLVNALKFITPINDKILESVKKDIFVLIKKTNKKLSADNEIVTQFWDTFDYLETKEDREFNIVNYSKEKDKIVLNFNKFMEVAREYKQNLPNFEILKRLLKISKMRPLICTRRSVRISNKTDLNKKILTCWVFKREAVNV